MLLRRLLIRGLLLTFAFFLLPHLLANCVRDTHVLFLFFQANFVADCLPAHHERIDLVAARLSMVPIIQIHLLQGQLSIHLQGRTVLRCVLPTTAAHHLDALPLVCLLLSILHFLDETQLI